MYSDEKTANMEKSFVAICFFKQIFFTSRLLGQLTLVVGKVGRLRNIETVLGQRSGQIVHFESQIALTAARSFALLFRRAQLGVLRRIVANVAQKLLRGERDQPLHLRVGRLKAASLQIVLNHIVWNLFHARTSKVSRPI